MQPSLLCTAIAALVASVSADCPSQRLDYHVIKRAIDYEAIKRDSLVARSNLNVNIYLHNVAAGTTYNEAYVSVSLAV